MAKSNAKSNAKSLYLYIYIYYVRLLDIYIERV